MKPHQKGHLLSVYSIKSISILGIRQYFDDLCALSGSIIEVC